MYTILHNTFIVVIIHLDTLTSVKKIIFKPAD